MGVMNDFLTMVHENFVPSSGREQGINNLPNCQHHQQQQHQQQPQPQQTRRRPRRLNCERAKLLNGLVGARCDARPGRDGPRQGGDEHTEDFSDVNWDSMPAPPITPPAGFRPNPESCYRRVSALRRGKKRGKIRNPSRDMMDGLQLVFRELPFNQLPCDATPK